MSSKRITRVTVERDRIWIIRQFGSRKRNRCERCGTEVEFLSMEQAIALTGMAPDEIKHSILAANVHTSSGKGEAMSICLNSLLEDAPALKGSKTTQAS